MTKVYRLHPQYGWVFNSMSGVELSGIRLTQYTVLRAWQNPQDPHSIRTPH
jgi:hypothetical protein